MEDTKNNGADAVAVAVPPAVSVRNLTFRYNTGVGTHEKGPIVLGNLNLEIPRGSRCLVVGGNGAGNNRFNLTNAFYCTIAFSGCNLHFFIFSFFDNFSIF
jgi:ABC-type multidrug transport system fused ATPase/permease subunit